MGTLCTSPPSASVGSCPASTTPTSWRKAYPQPPSEFQPRARALTSLSASNSEPRIPTPNVRAGNCFKQTVLRTCVRRCPRNLPFTTTARTNVCARTHAPTRALGQTPNALDSSTAQFARILGSEFRRKAHGAYRQHHSTTLAAAQAPRRRPPRHALACSGVTWCGVEGGRRGHRYSCQSLRLRANDHVDNVCVATAAARPPQTQRG